MTSTANKIKKDKRTESMSDEEIEQLKRLSETFPTFSAFSVEIKIERTALINTMARGSASPATIRKIRKVLAKQLQTA